MSDEAYFPVPGCVNKQKCRYWDSSDPHELHQCLLYSAKVTVWSAVSSHGIIGPYFFENAEGHTVTVNAEHYTVMLDTFLHNDLHPHQQDLLWLHKMEQLLTQHKFPCKASGQCFWSDSFLILGTSPGPPACLTLQDKTTSSGATFKAGYTKHVLPVWMT